MKQIGQEIDKISAESFFFILIETRFTIVDRENVLMISLRTVNYDYTIVRN